MASRLSIIAAIIIIIALFAWAPWMSEASAKDSAKTAFEAKWKGVRDGCSFDSFGTVEKKAFGYKVTINAGCGMGFVNQTNPPHEEKWFIYSFGITKEEVAKPTGEQPPTSAPATPAPTPALTVSNFAFAETSTGPKTCSINIENKITFSGPLTKPTPCNGLNATYSIEKTSNVDTVMINVTTTPFEGFCAQVMTDTFYTGSFDISQLPDKGLAVQVYYGGKMICNTALLPNPAPLTDKEQSCINSGGNVTTGMCCGSVDDFPETCAIGACGCSLENSHSVKMCDCGEGSCFNGNSCTEPCIGSGCPTY